MGIAVAKCPPTNYCKPDFTPMLLGGIGALIGSRFKADDWVQVRWAAR